MTSPKLEKNAGFAGMKYGDFIVVMAYPEAIELLSDRDDILFVSLATWGRIEKEVLASIQQDRQL
jgi:hypothetical protein